MAESQLLRDLQQWSAAYEVLGQATARLPKDADLLYEEAMMAEKLGKLPEMEQQLRRAIEGISDRMLSERLKELEAEGIVVRTVIPAMPVRVEYRLTEKGRALEPVLDAISQWAGEWLGAPPENTEPSGSATITCTAGFMRLR